MALKTLKRISPLLQAAALICAAALLSIALRRSAPLVVHAAESDPVAKVTGGQIRGRMIGRENHIQRLRRDIRGLYIEALKETIPAGTVTAYPEM